MAKNILKTLGAFALGIGLGINAYSQDTKNIILTYVSPVEENGKGVIKYDSIIPYNVYSEGDVGGLFMGTRNLIFDPPLKTYFLTTKGEKTLVVPVIIEGGHKFKKNPEKKIKKELQEILGKEEIYVSKPAKLGSGEMYFGLTKKIKKNKKK